MTQTQRKPAAATQTAERYEAIIIGAGMSGMYQLHELRKFGMSVRVFEAGTDVGGTWYWNRYPGARFDSESYSYGFSFSQDILDKWDWSEHFSAQPETLRYLNFVADELDLRRDMEFNARVTTAVYDEPADEWEITLEDGRRARAPLLITALGPLSTPTMPNIPGVEDYKGEAYHTGLWPHHAVTFANKRVAVIGTGATGVQTIQEVAKTVGHLTVFQRTPNYCAPLVNRPIDAETQKKIHASYPEIFAQCKRTHGSFLHDADPRKAMEVSPEEREAFYEKLYNEPGFGIWMGNFRDVLVDPEANETISEFVRAKIRQRVKDPAVAEKLTPRDHGFGTRRVPLETNYYEVYNQDNVMLVDVNETPIERITEKGIKTSEREYEFDMIIYATGFDAVTGGFDRIEFRGRDGITLKEKWADGPKTYLGLQVAGFPNMLTLVGPHNAATFCNIPRCIEQNVEWVTGLVGHMREHGLSHVEASEEAEAAWTEHVHETGRKLLFTRTRSWFMGMNTNLAHKQKPVFLLYAGGAPQYRAKCDEVAAAGYQGMMLS